MLMSVRYRYVSLHSIVYMYVYMLQINKKTVLARKKFNSVVAYSRKHSLRSTRNRYSKGE